MRHKTLSKAGVKNIELNVFATNINLNGNLLSEAGRYSDSTGTRSLAADVELTFDARITTVDTSLIPDYTVHPESLTLPKLRGYGTVYNSEIAYNVNDTLRNLAISMSHDITAVAKNFDAFIAEWSGLNTLLRTAQEKYALASAPILSEVDKKVWVYEHFMGDSRFSSGIESRINATASAMKTGGSANVEEGAYNIVNVNAAFLSVEERYQAVFALQALYPQITNSTLTYDISTDEFVISNPSAFTANVSEYINSITETLEQKLFLADVMNTLETTFLDFSAANITASITDPLMKELVSSIYAGTLKANVYGNGIYSSGNVLAVGSEGDDTITINGSSGSTILAGEGDDVIHGSTGNDVYLYRTGDGADTIIDGGGNDTLRLTDMIQSDIILRAEGKNLIIARAEVGKTFDELTDKVTHINWADSTNRVENIRFSDGSAFDFKNVINTYFVTEEANTLDLTASDDTLDALGGNDRVHGMDGNDTINGGAGDDILYGDSGDDKLFGGLGNDTLNGDEGNDLLSGAEGTNTLKGGDGNDTYLLTKGANTTTIEDKSASGFFFFGLFTNNDAGNDTVRFGEGITKDDISFLMNGDDLILQYGSGELMTVKNQDNNDTKIEKFELNDGSYLTNTDMDKIIQQLNAYKADQAISITNNDQLRQNQAMMNIIASGWHQ